MVGNDVTKSALRQPAKSVSGKYFPGKNIPREEREGSEGKLTQITPVNKPLRRQGTKQKIF
jgi:hypothetical protein